MEQPQDLKFELFFLKSVNPVAIQIINNNNKKSSKEEREREIVLVSFSRFNFFIRSVLLIRPQLLVLFYLNTELFLHLALMTPGAVPTRTPLYFVDFVCGFPGIIQDISPLPFNFCFFFQSPRYKKKKMLVAQYLPLFFSKLSNREIKKKINKRSFKRGNSEPPIGTVERGGRPLLVCLTQQKTKVNYPPGLPRLYTLATKGVQYTLTCFTFCVFSLCVCVWNLVREKRKISRSSSPRAFRIMQPYLSCLSSSFPKDIAVERRRRVCVSKQRKTAGNEGGVSPDGHSRVPRSINLKKIWEISVCHKSFKNLFFFPPNLCQISIYIFFFD